MKTRLRKEQVMCKIKQIFFLTALLSCVFLVIFGFRTAVEAQEDLSVLKGWRRYSDAENALYNAIAGEAYKFLDSRDRMIEDFRSLSKIFF